MSLYCIGDLHGRYDLFLMALEKINFNNKKDKIFILGDVIDVNYGAVKILRHIIQYPKSFELIQGNHEFQFIVNMEESYDVFMLDDGIKAKVKDVMDYYFDAYESIDDLIRTHIRKKDIQSIKEKPLIVKYLMPSKKREQLLDAIINLILYLDYDIKKFEEIIHVLRNTDGIFKTKQFVKELLETSSEEYVHIKEYLRSRKMELRFQHCKKKFLLIHVLFNSSRIWIKHIHNMKSKDTYVLYGHDPVAKIHRAISRDFDFNYREVFSYIDRYNNHYYDLDMTGNVVAILRLNDFEEFYVMKSKKESGKTSEVVPPVEPVNERKVGYKIVDSSFPVYASKKGFSFVTYKDFCMEYLVGVNKFKKIIYYKRVDYMDYIHKIAIEGWYDNQSIEEIISKVNEDYNTKKDSQEYINIEKVIRRMSYV